MSIRVRLGDMLRRTLKARILFCWRSITEIGRPAPRRAEEDDIDSSSFPLPFLSFALFSAGPQRVFLRERDIISKDEFYSIFYAVYPGVVTSERESEG
jgi:hypothetical protein